jgi:hypothetical protein
MTGLEPHPILEIPSAEAYRRLQMRFGEHEARKNLEKYLQDRARRMALEKEDPFNYGYEPEIWHVVDDLLVDGNKVVLDVSRLEKLGAKGLADVPKEIQAASEIYIAGANRSSKSEYAGKKIMKVLKNQESARTWSFADTGPISIARQQPIFWKYLPVEIKRLAAGTGKARQGAVLNISYKQKTGFAEQSFVLPNKSQHWFKNYEQDPENVEGDQLDAIWMDELRNVELLRTLRGRMIDRGGIVIVTFTAIDENYTAVVNEYERGARTVLEVEAELLPIKRPFSRKHVNAHTTRDQKEPATAGSPAENNFPVPVPADADRLRASVGQAREGTPSSTNDAKLATRLTRETADSRGGENLSGGDVELGDHSPGGERCITRPSPSAQQFEIVGYKKVPRIKVAGPGTDGNQRANIVYFHAMDNPYFGYEGAMQRRKEGRAPMFGKERFYRAYRNATEPKILSRVYGILTARSAQQFPKFNDAWHVIEPDGIPRAGTNYHIVDPCDGRNWFMLWIRIDPRGRWHVYREWPSTEHGGAYIPGIGDPGPWTLPGQPADGVRGPAQQAFGFGLDRYAREILRVEGHPENEDEEEQVEERADWWRATRNPLAGRQVVVEPKAPWEEIAERWMDSRYGATPTTTREGSTTLIEQMSELGMEFLATSGKSIEEGTGLINDMLDYDKEVERGVYSPTLARLNEPKLVVSRNCPNTIYAVREWTGKDKQHGACKDPIDCLRYAALAGLDYLGEDAYCWVGGGSY